MELKLRQEIVQVLYIKHVELHAYLPVLTAISSAIATSLLLAVGILQSHKENTKYSLLCQHTAF